MNTIGKQYFTSLCSPARAKAFTKKNITAAWAATSLFPFNPDRVLRATPKPPELGPAADEAKVCSRPPDDILHTPVTPVLAEALVSLHNLIKQDSDAIDETRVKRREKNV